jgi:hypothetical protein
MCILFRVRQKVAYVMISSLSVRSVAVSILVVVFNTFAPNDTEEWKGKIVLARKQSTCSRLGPSIQTKTNGAHRCDAPIPFLDVDNFWLIGKAVLYLESFRSFKQVWPSRYSLLYSNTAAMTVK